MEMNLTSLAVQFLVLAVAVQWTTGYDNAVDPAEVKIKPDNAGRQRGPRGDNLPLHLPNKNPPKLAKAKGDLGTVALGVKHRQENSTRKAPSSPIRKNSRSHLQSTISYSQHHVFLENQHAAFRCPTGQFITRLHVSYAGNQAQSTSFTYGFQFRRQPVVLAKFGSSNVNQYSCHGLKYCVGHRACLFQVTSGLCLHDPSPSRRKVLTVRVACEASDQYHGPSRTAPLLQQLSTTTGVLTLKQKMGSPVVVETSLSQSDVFGVACPQQQSDEFRSRFTGQCRNPPPPASKVSADFWQLSSRAPTVSCRVELLDVYCAYQYNSTGGCLPRFLVTGDSKIPVGPMPKRQAEHVVKRAAFDEKLSIEEGPRPTWLFKSFPEPRQRHEENTEKHQSSSLIPAINPVRIAFAILVHDHATVALQLLRSLFDPSHFYVVHVDEREDAVRQALIKMVVENFVRRGYHNVRVLPKKRSVVTSAGSYGVVRAQLIATEELLSMGQWDFAVVSLNGLDMALRSVDDIAALLASHRGSSFVRVSRFWNTRQFKSDAYAWHQCAGHPFVFNVTKRSRPAFALASASSAPAISREAAELIVTAPGDEVSSVLQFVMETSLNAAEAYIPTVLMRSHLRDSLHSSRLMVTKTYGPEDTSKCAVLKEVDACIPDAGVYRGSDLPFLRRSSFESMFARRFEDDADNPVRGLVSSWAHSGLGRHVQRSYAGDAAARSMAALIARKVMGSTWRSQANVSVISTFRVLPQLVPGQPCCQNKMAAHTGLLGDVHYWLDFSVKMAGVSKRKRIRGAVSQLPRTQCFPGGHVSTMMFGTRFLVRDGRHSPWTSLVPAAWDPAGDTSFWVLVVLNTDNALPGQASCSQEDFLKSSELWRSRYPHLQAETHATGKWQTFSAINTSLQFVLHLVDPKGVDRCQRSFSVHWRKADLTSWQSWRFFSCGALEPGLWTARLVPKDKPEDAVYESHVFLYTPDLRNTPITNSMSSLWTVDHAAFLNSSSSGHRTGRDRSFFMPPTSSMVDRSEFNLRKLHLLKNGFKRKVKVKVKAKAGNRQAHVFKSRPGNRKLTAFERLFSLVAGLALRFALVVGVLYVLLVKVLHVKIRSGQFSIFQAVLLISAILVTIQTALYSRLP